jgi:hydrogenase maturation protease
MSRRILIAGIGNIFHGDDAFGVEVARELGQRSWPEGVQVMDFGIRGYDLAYALTDGYYAVILVDAVPKGGAAGTTYLIELDPEHLPESGPEGSDAHSLHPLRALQMAQRLGRVEAKLFLVGCEPATLESEEGRMELSPAVRAAIPEARAMIEKMVSDLLGENENVNAGFEPV